MPRVFWIMFDRRERFCQNKCKATRHQAWLEKHFLISLFYAGHWTRKPQDLNVFISPFRSYKVRQLWLYICSLLTGTSCNFGFFSCFAHFPAPPGLSGQKRAIPSTAVKKGLSEEMQLQAGFCWSCVRLQNGFTIIFFILFSAHLVVQFGKTRFSAASIATFAIVLSPKCLVQFLTFPCCVNMTFGLKSVAIRPRKLSGQFSHQKSVLLDMTIFPNLDSLKSCELWLLDFPPPRALWKVLDAEFSVSGGLPNYDIRSDKPLVHFNQRNSPLLLSERASLV